MTRFSSETRGGCAILRRLQDRGAPAGAAPLRVAVLASLGHRPKPFFAVAVPATLESPGRAVRGTPVHRAKGPPDPLQCSGSPAAWVFAGTTVHRIVVFLRFTHRTLACCRLTHRTLALFGLTHWRLGKSAARPGRARSGGKTATGTSLSAALPLQATVSEINARHVSTGADWKSTARRDAGAPAEVCAMAVTKKISFSTLLLAGRYFFRPRVGLCAICDRNRPPLSQAAGAGPYMARRCCFSSFLRTRCCLRRDR